MTGAGSPQAVSITMGRPARSRPGSDPRALTEAGDRRGQDIAGIAVRAPSPPTRVDGDEAPFCEGRPGVHGARMLRGLLLDGWWEVLEDLRDRAADVLVALLGLRLRV